MAKYLYIDIKKYTDELLNKFPPPPPPIVHSYSSPSSTTDPSIVTSTPAIDLPPAPPGSKPRDALTINRINLMHPNLRADLLRDYIEINDQLPAGITLRFAQTYRSPAEQHALFLKRPKVTNADAYQSNHNYGLAFDIVILKNGVAKWRVDANWMKVVNFFKSKGWKWGGDWRSFKDYPHLEKTFGNSIRDLRSKPVVMDNGRPYPIL
jgi:peptidoglycan L-alanyl-D-glutamate endopeptidase CwlK